MRATRITSEKNIARKTFFISRNELFQNVFLSPEIELFFLEIGNNLMCALGRKKTHVFFLNTRPKSSELTRLKQRKKRGGLSRIFSKTQGVKVS